MRNRGLAVVLAAFVLAGCASQPAPSPAVPPLQSAYEKSIALAALKAPDFVRPLTPITDDEVTVAHLQPRGQIDPTSYLWVALPPEVRAQCAGKSDALLAMQMTLGMPPRPSPAALVFLFKVRRADLFRPCASSASVTTGSCALDFNLPSVDRDQPFVLKQMMESYRTRGGYPFTAMGWSYNWDPAATTPMGISEYVVRPAARMRDVTSMTPAQFCAGGS